MRKKISWLVEICIFPVLLVSVCLFAYRYVISEHTIYYWDYILYWHRYLEISPLLTQNILQYIHSIWQSVQSDPYNNLPVIALTPFYYLIGLSRADFILSILLSYGFLGFVGLFFLVNRIVKPYKIGPYLFLLLFINYFFSINVMGPVLRGYVDIGGLFFFFLAGYIFLRANWSESISKKSVILTVSFGFVCILLPLFRRFFAYELIGIVIVLPLIKLLSIIRNRSGINGIWFFHYFIFLVSLPIMFVILSGSQYKSYLYVDYAQLYSAWKENFSYISGIKRIIGNFGLLPSLFMLFSFIYCAISRYKKIAFASTLIVIISILLFWRVQYLDYHHYYVILGPILLVESITIVSIFQNRKFFIFSVILLVIIFLNLIQSINPHLAYAQFSISSIPIFSNELFPPLIRSDVPILSHIVKDLNTEWDQSGQIYVGASSQYLSDDILRNICYQMYSFDYPLCNAIPGAAQVDSRDGYPVKLLSSEYVIITNPVQYHIDPSEQKTVTFVSRFIDYNLEDYMLLHTYVLEHGIQVEVYKNIVPIKKKTIKGWNDLEN